MAPGAPRGKRKPVRGGGKNFSRNLKPLGDDDEETSVPQDTWGKPHEKEVPGDSSSEEEPDDGNGGGSTQPLSREERRAAAKALKAAAKARLQQNTAGSGSDEEGEEETPALAPRMQTHGHAGIEVSNPNDATNSVAGGLSRREREAVEAAAAKERYWKLQEAGKTDQARADMARLAIIKQEREEKARQRKAELEERKAEAEAKADARGKRK